MAPFHLQVDLLLDLVHGNVAGAFDHHLNVVLPGFLGQFAQHFEFGELRFVAGVGDRAGPQAVAERKTYVVLLEHFADFVEVFVEKILFFVMLHPMSHKRATAANDTGDALAHERHVFAHDAGMDGHVIDTLLGLLFDDFEHQREGQVFRAPHAGNGFVDRNRAHGHGRRVNDGFADFRNIPAGREVHHRIRAVVDGVVQFLEFFVNVRAGRGISDVRVDFAFAGDANGHRLEVAVVYVRGNDHAPARDFAANQFRLQFFAPGDVFHFLADDALTRKMHLGHVPAAVGGGRSRFAFFNPAIAQCHTPSQIA